MKDRVNQLFKDKLILVTLVLGLVVAVAAAGTITIRNGKEQLEESPYLEIQEPENLIIGEIEEIHSGETFNATEAAMSAETDKEEKRMNAEIHEADHVVKEANGEADALEAGGS